MISIRRLWPSQTGAALAALPRFGVRPDVDINKQPPAPRTAHTRCWDSVYNASLPRMRWDKRVQTGAVLLWLLLLPALLAPAIITGKGGLGPEAKFDADAMFGVPSSAQLRPYDDATPYVLEYPHDVYLAQRVRSGHFDLWNPLQGFGAPHLADQQGVLNPLRLIYYLHPSHRSHLLFCLSKLVLAGVGAFFLARQRGLSILAALAAASLFEICGGMISQLPFTSAAPTVLLPWVLLGIEQMRAGRSRAGLITLSLSLALTPAMGHPTLAMVVGVGGATYALGTALRLKSRALRLLPLLAAAGLIAALLALPVLTSFAQLLAHGHSYKLTEAGQQTWTYGLAYNRISAFLGFGGSLLIGSLLDRVAEVNRVIAFPYTLHTTIGLTTALLAFCALAARRWDAPLLTMCLVGVLLSYDPPGQEWVQSVPLLKNILPRYAWPLMVLPMILWAGTGIDLLRRLAVIAARTRPQNPRRPSRKHLTRLLAVGTTGTVVMWLGTAAMLQAYAARTANQKVQEVIAYCLSHPVLLLLPLVGLGLVVLVAYVLGRSRPRWLGPFLVASAVLELIISVQPLVVSPPSRAQQRPLPAPVQRLAQLTQQTHSRISASPSMLSMSQIPMLAGIADARVCSALVPARFADYIATAGANIGWTYFALPTAHSPYLDLAAARYILTTKSEDDPLAGDPRLVRLFETVGAAVYQNHSALPRFRLVHQTLPARNRKQAAQLLSRNLFGRSHVEDTKLYSAVILEGLSPAEALQAPTAEGSATPEDVDLLEDSPDQQLIRTHSTQPGFLVIADAFYPGWEATLDGAPRPIYPANVAFRAIAIPAGEHTVCLRYRLPVAWLVSPVLGLGVLLGLCWVLGSGTRRRER